MEPMIYVTTVEHSAGVSHRFFKEVDSNMVIEVVPKMHKLNDMSFAVVADPDREIGKIRIVRTERSSGNRYIGGDGRLDKFYLEPAQAKPYLNIFDARKCK